MEQNKDIPLEAVLKYIKRDRDNYKAKLDKLVPYAKSLEANVERMCRLLMEPERTKLATRINELQETVKRQERQLDSLRDKNTKLALENDLLVHEYTSSRWYQDLMRQHGKRKDKIKELQIALNRVLQELYELKKEIV